MYGKDGRWYHVRHLSVGRQLEVYHYIQGCSGCSGHHPTLQEIAEEVNVSVSTAKGYLHALENAGLIRRCGSDLVLSTAEDLESTCL